MKLSTTIEFKSIPEIYEKESSNLKNNTVRAVTKDDDRRIRSCENIAYIRIVNRDNRSCTSSFVRTITDITRYVTISNEIIYVFTWEK
jgi:hypothetical protein